MKKKKRKKIAVRWNEEERKERKSSFERMKKENCYELFSLSEEFFKALSCHRFT